jgi:hypothetical protein
LLLADQFAQVALDLPPDIFFAIIAHESLGKIKSPQVRREGFDRNFTSSSTRPPNVLDDDVIF